MMAHATAVLAAIQRPNPARQDTHTRALSDREEAAYRYSIRPADGPVEAGTEYRKRAIKVLAIDLRNVTQATRALLDELYPFLPILPMAWDEAAELVGWVAPAERPGSLAHGDDDV